MPSPMTDATMTKRATQRLERAQETRRHLGPERSSEAADLHERGPAEPRHRHEHEERRDDQHLALRVDPDDPVRRARARLAERRRITGMTERTAVPTPKYS